ncbi:hypothetical protein HPP92_014887 [Vanilla planifolia]|uniref:Uncharacterized protein n=1 Tax=Vanilla planifolia TaxID=51239 RepID=A0A835QGU8_VANPL|nr:hypothetical protein HPP92_014887 [Vanilla planifolia]
MLSNGACQLMEENGESSVAVRRIQGLDRISNYNSSSGILTILSVAFSSMAVCSLEGSRWLPGFANRSVYVPRFNRHCVQEVGF